MREDGLPDLGTDELIGIAEWVYLNTIADLAWRNMYPESPEQRYQILGIAPLLRKLLIDKGALVHRVNQKRKLPLEFRIRPFAMTDRECVELIESHGYPASEAGYWRVFYPSSLVPTSTLPGETLGIAHFLRAHVGVITGRRVSVRELIQFYCIVEGGVHIGEGRTDLERDMLRTVPGELTSLNAGVYTSPIGVLVSLANIVISSLSSLTRAIEAKPGLANLHSDFRLDSSQWKWRGGLELNQES